MSPSLSLPLMSAHLSVLELIIITLYSLTSLKFDYLLSRQCLPSTHYRCAVVEWCCSRPLDCEVRGSNLGQGRNFKRGFCFIRTPAVVKACHPCRLRP